MNLRKLTSLTSLLSFVLLLITSIVLYILPHGRVAYWSDWHLWGLDKPQWGALHINIGILFLIAIFVHTFLNIKPIINYLKNKQKKVVIFTPEFSGALIIIVICCLGTYFEVAPFSSVIGYGESLKEASSEKYGEPPYGHAELSSLKVFSQRVGIELDAAKDNLKSAGLSFDDEKKTILDIANQNQITPKELYQAMMPDVSIDIPELCDKYNLDVSHVLQILKNENIDTDANATIKSLAQKNDVSPIDVYTVIRNGIMDIK